MIIAKPNPRWHTEKGVLRCTLRLPKRHTREKKYGETPIPSLSCIPTNTTPTHSQPLYLSRRDGRAEGKRILVTFLTVSIFVTEELLCR